MVKSKHCLAAALITICFLVFPNRAFAYVDPGSGGFLFQILFIFFSATLGVIVIGFEKVKNMFINIFRSIGKIFTGSSDNKNEKKHK